MWKILTVSRFKKKPDTPKKLCNIVMTTSHPPWQLIGGQFSFVPTLYSLAITDLPFDPPEAHVILPKILNILFIKFYFFFQFASVMNERQT